MAIFYFSDVLRKVGLDPSKVKLIRHALTDRGFRECYKANVVYEYTCHQKSGFSKGYDYWVTFISDQGTLCKLDSCYKVGSIIVCNHYRVFVTEFQAFLTFSSKIGTRGQQIS